MARSNSYNPVTAFVCGYVVEPLDGTVVDSVCLVEVAEEDLSDGVTLVTLDWAERLWLV